MRMLLPSGKERGNGRLVPKLVERRERRSVVRVGVAAYRNPVAVGPRRQVSNIDRDRLRQVDLLLGGCLGDRGEFAAQQPAAEPVGVFEPDAAVTELAHVLL